MHADVRRAALAILLMLSTACGESRGPSSVGNTQPSPLPSIPAPPQPTFPPLSGPSRTFTFAQSLSYPVRDYTTHSRFVLYDDGGFVLQYPTLGGGGGYRGGYTEANGVLVFQWEGF